MSKIHLLNLDSISNLKRKAKKLCKNTGISLSQAHHEISIELGFSNWKDLLKTYEHETKSKYRIRHVSYDRTDLKPFEDEAKELQAKTLLAQGINLEDYNKNFASHFEEDFFNDRQPKWSDLVSQSHFNAEEQVAKKYNFKDWEDLRKKHTKEIVHEEFTLEQKIGATARSLGINPRSINNTIHVAIEADNDGLIQLSKDDWQKIGFIEDHDFSRWISQNDAYLAEIGFIDFFRVIAVDTESFLELESYLDTINEKLEIFFPVFASCAWINGKTDPRYLIPDNDYPDDPLPISEIPIEIWKRGY